MLLTERTTTETAAEDPRLVAAAIRAFFALAEAWGVDADLRGRLLGGVGRTTLHGWGKTPPSRVSTDQMQRLSFLLGIHALLRQLFPNTPGEQMSRRIRQPLPWLGGGRSLLDFMLEGGLPAMHHVRAYLVSENGDEIGALPSREGIAQAVDLAGAHFLRSRP